MNTSQTDFRAALFDPDIAVPPSLTDGENRPAGKRFDVYRNNVIVSLKEALAESFPTVEKLIGAQNFSSLAGLYVRAHPPSDPRMMLYGADFPTFLDTFAPLTHVGYLPDIARLELARRRSYHAADTTPIDASIFSTMPPDQLALTCAGFAPSMQLIRSPWPILDIWHFNMTEGAPQPSGHAQDVLVTRAGYDPEMQALAAGHADLIEMLQQGQRLGDALDAITQSHPDFDFSTFLGVLLQTGAVITLSSTD